jgi:putative AdoMet-dependent methyltransferase
VTDLFKERAETYDSRDIAKELSTGIGATLLKEIPFHDGMEVMDFGAGTGLICSHVAPLVKKITAVDISESMLDKLMSKQELQGKVETVCQDIMETPLDEKFDLIMSAFALHHVEDTDRLIQSLANHLKPGASIALADLDTEDGSFHPEELKGVFHLGFNRDTLKVILEQQEFKNIDFKTAFSINRDGKDYSVFLVVATKDSGDGD